MHTRAHLLSKDNVSMELMFYRPVAWGSVSECIGWDGVGEELTLPLDGGGPNQPQEFPAIAGWGRASVPE